MIVGVRLHEQRQRHFHCSTVIPLIPPYPAKMGRPSALRSRYAIFAKPLVPHPGHPSNLRPGEPNATRLTPPTYMLTLHSLAAQPASSLPRFPSDDRN